MTTGADATPRPYAWMLPAIALGALRPGLRAATTGDAARLRELPGWYARAALPLLAVSVPLALSVLHAMRPIGAGYGEVYADPSPWTFLIWTTFTESISFVVVAAAMGLLSPAAGVLVALTYALTDLPAAWLTGEMRSLPGALFGRMSSYLLLWLLVVEVPIIARTTFETIARTDDAAMGRRRVALLIGVLVSGALVFVWAEGARQLISGLHQLSSLTVPGGVYTQLYYTSPVVAIVGGAFAAGALYLRYLGAQVHLSRAASAVGTSGHGSIVWYLVGAGIAMLLLSGYIDQPIDALILLAAVLLARPAAIRVLRLTRLGGLLVRIPWSLRFLSGFGLAFILAWKYLEVAGISQVSRFGYMVIATAVGLFVIELLLAAEDSVGEREQSRARAAVERVGVTTLLLLAFPMIAAAHSGHQEANAIAGSAAAGAAAAAAAAAAAVRRKPANPSGRDDQNWRTQNNAYDAGGINMHGGSGLDG